MKKGQQRKYVVGSHEEVIDRVEADSTDAANAPSEFRCSTRQGYGRQVERKRCGLRADVNKPRVGATTALTISGILRPVVVEKSGSSGPRSGERRRCREISALQALGSHRVVQSTHAHGTHENDTSRPTLRSRLTPMQFTSPHPAPDWRGASVRATTSRCSVHRPAPRAPSPPRPAALPTRSPPRARPTSVR
ncbi:unnamed protein product [Diatraea saccharalis]|uniref:Uncharacterized protein n=1 Tax=Diatraea saccharalis TaxID=40085 RepID=A0A9N9RHC4_9NEOP|nr:unnamed protein product [Diatraea saccharalis]